MGLITPGIVPDRGVALLQGFFSKLFSFGKSDNAAAPLRYRIAVKGEGDKTNVTVQNSQGVPEATDVGRRIVALLVDDLK